MAVISTCSGAPDGEAPRSSEEEVRADLLIHGCYITRNGQRIDPFDFYVEPECAEKSDV